MNGLIPNPTQCQKVMDYLLTHPMIDFKIAEKQLHIHRLAARVWELKRKKVQFTETTVPFINESGNHGNYTEYSLAIKEGQQEMAL